MLQDQRDILAVLRSELKFLETGGYRWRPRSVSWRAPCVFEDSPSCPNFCCPATRSLPCSECALIQLVPPELRKEAAPCRLIPLDDKGQTIDFLYRYGTQLEIEEALGRWLRGVISKMEGERTQGIQASRVLENGKELDAN